MTTDTTNTTTSLPAWVVPVFDGRGGLGKIDKTFLEGTSASLHEDGTVTTGFAEDVLTYPSLSAYIATLIEDGDVDDVVTILADLRDHVLLEATRRGYRAARDGDTYFILREKFGTDGKGGVTYSAELAAAHLNLAGVVEFLAGVEQTA